MNPSYNNGLGNSGAGNVPGAKPGVIASGPDPADEPVAPQSFRRSSRQPSGARPGGSIILNTPSAGPKKSRKGLIGGLLAAVALVIAVVAVVLVMQGGDNGGGGKGGSTDSAFLRYANYILNGTESTNSLGEYEPLKLYAASDAYYSNDKSFFDTAQKLWNNFYNNVAEAENYSVISDPTNSALGGDIEYENELLDFMVKYMATTKLEEEDLLKLYMENGVDGANTKVDENYAALMDTIFDIGRDYAALLISYAKKALNIYSIYDSNNCIINGEIDNNCVKNNTITASAYEQYLANRQDIDTALVNRTVEELEKFCFKINDNLRNDSGKDQ